MHVSWVCGFLNADVVHKFAVMQHEVKCPGRTADSQDKHGTSVDFLETEACEVEGALGRAWLGNTARQAVLQGLLPVPLALVSCLHAYFAKLPMLSVCSLIRSLIVGTQRPQ